MSCRCIGDEQFCSQCLLGVDVERASGVAGRPLRELTVRPRTRRKGHGVSAEQINRVQEIALRRAIPRLRKISEE